MLIPVTHSGFADKRVEVQTAGVFSSAKLLIDRQVVKPTRRNVYLLVDDKGQQREIRLINSFFDPIPKLEIGGEKILLARKLHWYEYTWMCLPLVLIFARYVFVAGIIGIMAAYINTRMFRSNQSNLSKYFITGGITFGAISIFYIVGGLMDVTIGDYKGAINECNEAIRLNPNDADAYRHRALSKRYLNDYKGAVDDYSKAIQLDPTDTDTYLDRAIAKGVLGDYKGAVDDYTRFIHQNPNDAAAYAGRGMAKNSLGDYKGAIDDLTLCIRLDPHNWLVDHYISNRGLAQEHLGNYRSAIEDMTQALQAHPDSVHAAAYYRFRGHYKECLGDYKNAVNDLTQCIQLNPNDVDAYEWRGTARQKLGDTEGANSDFNISKQLANQSKHQ